jgi:hypothetical protein
MVASWVQQPSAPMMGRVMVPQQSVLVYARTVWRSVAWPVAVAAWLTVPKRLIVGSHRGTSKS